MIELRWIVKRYSPSGEEAVKTLQYRLKRQNLDVHFVNEEDKWDKWMDVTQLTEIIEVER